MGHRNSEALYQLARKLHYNIVDKRKILQNSLTTAGEIMNVTQGCIITFNERDQVDDAFVLDANQNTPDDLWETLLTRGLLGFAYHSQRVIVISNIATDTRFPQIDSMPAEGSAVGIPLSDGRFVFGVLMLLHSQIDYFDDESVATLQEIADLASRAISTAYELFDSREMDSRYENLFDQNVVPIILSDMQGNIIDVNRKVCDMLEYGRYDLLNTSITKIHPEETRVFEKADLSSLALEEERTFRANIVAHSGVEIPVVVRIRRLELNGRNVIEWVEQDITPQMELEQLRGDLSAMVYHDLRGPLQTINATIYKMAKMLAGNENPHIATLLQLSMRSTRQLRSMVDSLLDIQRFEEGSAILDLQEMELRVLLIDAAQLIQPLAADAKQRLHVDIPENLPLVQADGNMIVRVIINLLENAIKYTPEGGTVTLSTRIKNDVAEISVLDSGPGIPADMKDRIFDKFNRVKYRNAPQGVGLGLAFCRLAVTEHGGRIWVESELGNGSEFIFTLPLDVVQTEPLETPEPPKRSKHDTTELEAVNV